jgi:TPR repeat protein
MTGLAMLLALLGCQDKKAQEPSVMLQMNCDGGDPKACYDLGNYKMNLARPDIPGARIAYSKACNVHQAEACNELGKMVRDAKGGPRDPKRATALFGIACEGGIMSACTDQGVMFYDGLGVTADPGRAVALFTPACQVDPPIALACSRLARAWAEGLGVESKDLEAAKTLHVKACDLNDAASCVELGKFILANGKKPEAVDAAVAFEKACGLDPRFGCFEFAELHRDELVPEASPEKAAVYFQKTCNIDPTRGCYEAAEILAAGKVPARQEEIESLYNVACEHGRTEACAKRSLE